MDANKDKARTAEIHYCVSCLLEVLRILLVMGSVLGKLYDLANVQSNRHIQTKSMHLSLKKF